MEFEDLLNGVSGIAIGGYLIAVVYQGNVKALGNQLWGEERYIEFLVALISLAALHKYGPTNKISTVLTAAALIGLAIRVVHTTDVPSVMKDFASGKKTMLETIQALLKGIIPDAATATPSIANSAATPTG